MQSVSQLPACKGDNGPDRRRPGRQGATRGSAGGGGARRAEPGCASPSACQAYTACTHGAARPMGWLPGPTNCGTCLSCFVSCGRGNCRWLPPAASVSARHPRVFATSHQGVERDAMRGPRRGASRRRVRRARRVRRPLSCPSRLCRPPPAARRHRLMTRGAAPSARRLTPSPAFSSETAKASGPGPKKPSSSAKPSHPDPSAFILVAPTASHVSPRTQRPPAGGLCVRNPTARTPQPLNQRPPGPPRPPDAHRNASQWPVDAMIRASASAPARLARASLWLSRPPRALSAPPPAPSATEPPRPTHDRRAGPIAHAASAHVPFMACLRWVPAPGGPFPVVRRRPLTWLSV